MNRTASGTSEGAIVLTLGMIFGALLAFVMLEYGTRQQQKGAAMMTPPHPTDPTGNIIHLRRGA